MLISEILPDSLNDQARFKQTAQRQLNAFNWVKQGWIPLSIIVNDDAEAGCARLAAKFRD